MNRPDATTTEPVPHERLAEAGVWISRLHGGARGREVEDGLRRWLQEDPVNARAFELATEVWNDSESLRQFVPLTPQTRSSPRHPPWFSWAAAAAAVFLFVIGGVLYQQAGVVATDVGEQRQVVLEDGTRVFLNTATRIAVSYDPQFRRVELKEGEALFNVAKKADWPFIVMVGNRQVQAIGTSFVVRKEAENVAVTLVEGKVLVTPRIEAPQIDTSVIPQPKNVDAVPLPAPKTTPASDNAGGGTYTLTPGQRLTFARGATARIDTPSVEKATAWRRGQVVLDDTPLSRAAAEMNRYNSIKLVVADPEAAQLLVNGLFQAGDSTHFANAVAQTYGLEVIERGDEIILSGVPRR